MSDPVLGAVTRLFASVSLEVTGKVTGVMFRTMSGASITVDHRPPTHGSADLNWLRLPRQTHTIPAWSLGISSARASRVRERARLSLLVVRCPLSSPLSQRTASCWCRQSRRVNMKPLRGTSLAPPPLSGPPGAECCLLIGLSSTGTAMATELRSAVPIVYTSIFQRVYLCLCRALS